MVHYHNKKFRHCFCLIILGKENGENCQETFFAFVKKNDKEIETKASYVIVMFFFWEVMTNMTNISIDATKFT